MACFVPVAGFVPVADFAPAPAPAQSPHQHQHSLSTCTSSACYIPAPATMVTTKSDNTTPDKDSALYEWLQENKHNVPEEDKGQRKSSRIRKLNKTHTPPAGEKDGGPAQLSRKTAGDCIIKPKASQPPSPASSPLQEPTRPTVKPKKKKSDTEQSPSSGKKARATKIIQCIIMTNAGPTTRMTTKPEDVEILPAVTVEVIGPLTDPSHETNSNIKPSWAELKSKLIGSLSEKRYANVLDERHHASDYTVEIVFLIKLKKVRSLHSSARVFENVTVICLRVCLCNLCRPRTHPRSKATNMCIRHSY